MGDKYIAGQVGVQGPNAKAKDMTFTHIGDFDHRSINIETLVDELGQLRKHLKEISATPEHDIAVGHVANAEREAKIGNRDAAFAALAQAGRWALDAAQAIGLGVAANVLRGTGVKSFILTIHSISLEKYLHEVYAPAK